MTFFQAGESRLPREPAGVGRQQARRRRLVEQHARRGGEEGVRRLGEGTEEEDQERERVSPGVGSVCGAASTEKQEPLSLSAEAEEEPERFPRECEGQERIWQKEESERRRL